MTATLECFFDYGSPFSYLADTQLDAVAARTGATIVHRPMLLGAVLKATQNSSPMAVPAKAAYMGIELERWATRYGMPFRGNSFPFLANTLRLMRIAVASQRLGIFGGVHPAIFRAIWAEGLDLGDERVLRGLLEPIPGADRLASAVDEAETKDLLRHHTDEAIRRGVFGAPTFFAGDEMYWGNDRLSFAEDALRRVAGGQS